MTARSCRKTRILKEIRVAAFLVAFKSCVEQQDTAMQTQVISLEDSGNATQIFKAFESMEQIIEKHHKEK